MLPQHVQAAVDRLLALFESGDVPQALAHATYPRLKVPSACWSFRNRLLMLLQGTEDARGAVAVNLEKECVSEKGRWWKKQPSEVAAIEHFERSWLFSCLAQQVAGGWWHRDMDSLDIDHEGRSLSWGDKEIGRYEND